MKRLLRWATSRGAECKVATQDDRPRTLFAAQDIAPGDVVFSLPSDLLLQGYSALHDEEYGPAFRALLQEVTPQVLDQRSLLVLLLLLEKCRGQRSAFAPYIDMLPQTYDDPFWWSESDLQILQGTRLQQAVPFYETGLHQLHEWVVRLEQLHVEIQQQQQQCQSGSSSSSSKGGTLTTALSGWGLTRDAVRWARSAVWSRAFTVRGLKSAAAAAAAGSSVDGSSGAAVVALIPVLDMCDHHVDQRVTWRVVDHQQQQQQQHHQHQQPTQQQLFQFTTLKPVAKGSELFNNYGTTKPNEELLLGYGFVLHDNQHDKFLVTISHAASSATAAAAAGNGSSIDASAAVVDESTCDDAAVWQQRLSAMAAAGLRLEIPISISNPLPNQLLDVLLLAAAAPSWQLQLLQPLEAAAAAAAGSSDGSCPNDDLQQQQQQQQQSLYSKTPLYQQLRVLASLKQQLTAKLQGMVSLEQVNNMLDPDTVTVTHHVKLAAVYVKSQQQILTAALAAVQAAMYNSLLGAIPRGSITIPNVTKDVTSYQQSIDLQHHTSTAKDCCLVTAAAAAGEQGTAVAASGATSTLPDAKHLEVGPAFQWCDVCEALSTVGSSSSGSGSSSDGSSSSIPAGSTVLQLPLDSCLAAVDEQQLTMQLMLAAAKAAVDAAKEQQHSLTQASPAAAYFAQRWQQQSEGAASSAIPWWLQKQQQQIVELLQDTPVGQQLQQVVDDMQQDFRQLVVALQRSAAEATANIQDGDVTCSTNTSQQQQQQQQQICSLLQLIQADPKTAFEYFCWANHFVKQAAVNITIPAVQRCTSNTYQQSVKQQQQQQQQQMLLIPGLQNLPQDLCSLVLDISLRGSGSGIACGQQQLQQQHVVVKTCCDLPAGLLLHKLHPTFLAQRSLQQLTVEQGPVAVATAAAAERGSSTDHVGDHQQQQQQRQQHLQHMYEMLICPSEGDDMADLKLKLLACTGLGLCHNLLLLDQQQQLDNIITAMAISLCDNPALLLPAAVQQVAAEYQASVAAVKGLTSSVAAVSFTAAMLVDEDDKTFAAAATAAGSSKSFGAWQQLQEKLMQQYGKQCRVELLNALKADRQAVQHALHKIGQLGSAAATVKEAQHQDDLSYLHRSCFCMCGLSNKNGSSSDVMAAALDGVRICLEGLLSLISAWLQLVKGSGIGKRHDASKRFSGKEASTKKKSRKIQVDTSQH